MARDPAELARYFNDHPIAKMLRMSGELLDDGSAVCTLEPPADVVNPNGAVPGVLIASLADFAQGLVVAAAYDPDEYVATAHLSIHFVEAALAAPIRAESSVVRRGRAIAVAKADVYDARGALCSIATGTWAIRSGSAHVFP